MPGRNGFSRPPKWAMTRAMARFVSLPVRVRVLALIGTLLCLGTIAATPAPATAAPTTVAFATAAKATLSGGTLQTVADPSATSGSAIKFGWSGTATLNVTLPADADSVTLRVRGDQCSGAPAYTVSVDGAQLASDSVTSATWTTARPYSTPLVAGTHTVAVTFTNPLGQPWPPCSRVLYLDSVTFSSNGPLHSNPPIPAGFVHQSGTILLDGAGSPVRLHGVNVGGWLEWQGWIWGQGKDYVGESAMMNNLTNLVGATPAQQFQTDVFANYVTGSDFHAMSVDGFNAVRVPFNYRLLEDDAHPFTYKQSGWDVLDRVIQDAKQANVYVILDMSVAPCSQMYSFVSDYAGGPYLWSSQQCQDRMVAMWKAIAARYASENVIAGYDLLNETIIDDAQLISLYQRVTAAIRQVDGNHVIIYEGNYMARSFTGFTQPLDANEMLSFHDYAWAFPGQALSARMAGYDAAAVRLGAPLYAGEFGESTYADDQTYVNAFNNDPLTAAWTEWTWKQAPGFAAMQNIQHTPASQKLINWINNPTRPQPTAAEATQGMSDFINAVRFENTLPDAQLRGTLASPAPPAIAARSTSSAPPLTSASAVIPRSSVRVPAPASLAPGLALRSCRRVKSPRPASHARVRSHRRAWRAPRPASHARVRSHRRARRPHRGRRTVARHVRSSATTVQCRSR